MANTTGDNQTPNTDQDNDESTFVTKDELVRIVNSAISNRNKSFEKKMEEFMATFKPQQQDNPDAKPEKTTNTSEIASMKKQLEALKSERDAEVNKRKDQELTISLQDHLTKLGVPASRLKAVTAMLKHEDKAVGYDDDGNIVWNSKEGQVDLSTGVKQWAKTSEGKEFIAPVGVKGSGNKPAKSNQSSVPVYETEDEVWAKIAAGEDLTKF